MEEMRGILGSPDVVSVIEDASTNRLVTLPVNTLTIVSISIISVSVVAIIVLTFFLYREFGWDIYRALGADLRIRRYYFNYQVFECIVCYSFFFFAGFGVQVSIRADLHPVGKH
jgi:hypothetical protein